jgi:hypothetical protein
MMSPDVIAAIQALELDGRLTPDEVVKAAADKESPLHNYFTWDNSQAANSWRVDQARRLIASVKVVYRVEERTVTAVAYVRDPAVEPTQQGYVSVTHLRKDQTSAREAVLAEFSRAAALLDRARSIAEVLECSDDVDRAYRDVVRVRDLLKGTEARV